MNIDSMFEFPTYELRLNTSESNEGKIRTLQVGSGESFTMLCNVVGEVHDNPDLAWLKNGAELNTTDTLSIVDIPAHNGSFGKSIIFSGFEENKHTGIYECSVKRKDELYHSRQMRIEQKPGNLMFADGFTTCSERQNETICRNGGICMMHKSSLGISCLCINGRSGQRCERFGETDEISQEYKAGFAALSATIIALLIILIVCFCCSMKQRRQIKRLSVRASKQRASNHQEEERTPLHNKINQLDSNILAKLQEIDVRDEKYCWNCGYSRVFSNGTYHTRPNFAALNAERRADFFRDLSQQPAEAESVYSMASDETNETANGL